MILAHNLAPFRTGKTACALWKTKSRIFAYVVEVDEVEDLFLVLGSGACRRRIVVLGRSEKM